MDMLCILILAVCISSVFTADAINRIGCYNDHSRFFYFPGDGTNQYYLVDTQETTHISDIQYRTSVPSKNKYWLYTRANPTTHQVLAYGNQSSVTNSYLDGRKTTVFLIHGWQGNSSNLMSTSLTEAFLQYSDANIIVVDWSYWADQNYLVAVEAAMIVGEKIGKFCAWLGLFGVSLDKIHLVGFSLGAHIAGCAGRSTGSKVRRITGLDPAGPMWYENKFRLVKTDAQYVQVIHTNTLMFGYKEPCGDADFFPNGGSVMPECDFVCSHTMSYVYMAQSLKFKNMTAHKCNSFEDAIRKENVCFGAAMPMGDNDLSQKRSGILRMDTKNTKRETIEKKLVLKYNFDLC